MLLLLVLPPAYMQVVTGLLPVLIWRSHFIQFIPNKILFLLPLPVKVLDREAMAQDIVLLIVVLFTPSSGQLRDRGRGYAL